MDKTENENNVTGEARRRIDLIAEEGLGSIRRSAEAMREKIRQIVPAVPEQPQITGPETAEYRPPEIVRAAENAIMSGAVHTAPRQKHHAANTGARSNGHTSRRGENRRASSEEGLALLQRLADECAAELPREFFRELTGGISLTDRVKSHPQSEPARPLLVLGEYRSDRNLGRSIMLYGGSILRVYGRLPEAELKNELRRIIRHEFTHHIESLSGERGLEIEDEIRLEAYKAAAEAPQDS